MRISEQLRTLHDFNLEASRAGIAALLGDRDQAVSLLYRSFDEGMQYGPYSPQYWIDFESLHNYPPFQELIKPKG